MDTGWEVVVGMAECQNRHSVDCSDDFSVELDARWDAVVGLSVEVGTGWETTNGKVLLSAEIDTQQVAIAGRSVEFDSDAWGGMVERQNRHSIACGTRLSVDFDSRWRNPALNPTIDEVVVIWSSVEVDTRWEVVAGEVPLSVKIDTQQTALVGWSVRFNSRQRWQVVESDTGWEIMMDDGVQRQIQHLTECSGPVECRSRHWMGGRSWGGRLNVKTNTWWIAGVESGVEFDTRWNAVVRSSVEVGTGWEAADGKVPLSVEIDTQQVALVSRSVNFDSRWRCSSV
ncbi:hypothetical protein BKA70DRAFT_1241786 [Coprinopsis sp. MPI-PUGE-AT-0042]|nr:hypothetical protein BKA70DRAFT_1241786 [Coprinopsis sp. MPI-PUGE-AT-0042]